MTHHRFLGLVSTLCLVWTTPSRADQFEQLDGTVLAKLLRGAEATSRSSLTTGDLGAMTPLLKDTRSSLVLARTDQGNPTRLLLVPELRKPTGGVGEPIPVLVFDRLDTFDASDPSTRLNTRRDLVLFDGFQLDLDTGQIVPEGQGGDLVFRTGGKEGPRVEVVGIARLFTLAKAPAMESSQARQPSPGKTVMPGDFAGRYRLFANGQWSGTLDLKVEGRGVLDGSFRSDLHGTSYSVTGQVATDVANKVNFAIKYPRARQEFEGYLWAEGKGAIAGIASLNERAAGFFAVREGGKYAPAGTDLGPITPNDADRPGRLVIEVRETGLRLGGQVTTLEWLGPILKTKADDPNSPDPWVILRGSSDLKYADLIRVVEAIQSSGVKLIRFGNLEAER